MSGYEQGEQVQVPAKPFKDWLNREWRRYVARSPSYLPMALREQGAGEDLAERLGWFGKSGVRRLYRYRRGLMCGSWRMTGRPQAVLEWIDYAWSDADRRDVRRRTRTYTEKGERPAVWFPRAVVEDALHHAGVSFAELYPDIVAREDCEWEPEVWCPDCDDLTTAIDGQCLWCVGRREAALVSAKSQAEKTLYQIRRNREELGRAA